MRTVAAGIVAVVVIVVLVLVVLGSRIRADTRLCQPGSSFEGCAYPGEPSLNTSSMSLFQNQSPM